MKNHLLRRVRWLALAAAVLAVAGLAVSHGSASRALASGAPTPTPSPTNPAWQTPTPPSPTPTPTHPTQPLSLLFSKNFDRNHVGPLFTASDPHDFSALLGKNQLRVSSYVSRSPGHSLQVRVIPGASAYGMRTYGTGYMTQSLSFALFLPDGFQLPSGKYISLAVTQYRGGNVHAGSVELNLTSNRMLSFVVWDAHGRPSYGSVNGQIWTGIWTQISFTVHMGSYGSVSISMNGHALGGSTGLDLPTAGISSFAVGNIFSPDKHGSPESIYLDSIVARGK